jgi:nitrite reductase/ring-hydroxylating ferredoxin subunit
MPATDDPMQLGDWFVVAAARDVPPGQVAQAFLRGQEIALWRTADGAIQAWENRCPHRGTRLTMGRIVDDQLACAYHGWRFAARGGCTYIPAHPTLTPPKTVCAKTYRAAERYGMVWVCLGEPRADVPALESLFDDAHRFVFCRSFVTYLDADKVVEGLVGDARFGYAAVASHVLLGKEDAGVAPILLVQPMTATKSILHLWVRCRRGGDASPEKVQSACSTVRHQRRHLEMRP